MVVRHMPVAAITSGIQVVGGYRQREEWTWHAALLVCINPPTAAPWAGVASSAQGALARRKAVKVAEKCAECKSCETLVACPGPDACIGCGACVAACPCEALVTLEAGEPQSEVTILVNGHPCRVRAPATLKVALEEVGFHFADLPQEGGLAAPCRTGGCWACALLVDGELRPACLTPVREGMRVDTRVEPVVPRRIVSGVMGHAVGGVGTPWQLKGKLYLEVACFVAGCNLRCSQCQNWQVTYFSRRVPLTPEEAARLVTEARKGYGVDRLAISGGQATLNRRWLVEYLRRLREYNPDPVVRLHVDTNGSTLSEEYIDELVAAGMTDIGIDLKALRLQTFMRITGLQDPALAEKCRDTAWQAVGYLLARHPGVFLGIGIPYNRELISLAEIAEMGEAISKLNPEVQVCVLDYRPEFRRRDLLRPTVAEMRRVHATLRDAGLKNVVCQVSGGYLEPDGRFRSLYP